MSVTLLIEERIVELESLLDEQVLDNPNRITMVNGEFVNINPLGLLNREYEDLISGELDFLKNLKGNI